MFWGVTLESGKRYSQIVESSYHLSMAALEPTTKEIGKENKYVSVMIEHGKTEFLLCTLEYDRVMQIALDLVFVEGEEVSFFLNGEGIVHLTGYVTDEDEKKELDEESYSSEETEEENEVSDVEENYSRKLMDLDDESENTSEEEWTPDKIIAKKKKKEFKNKVPKGKNTFQNFNGEASSIEIAKISPKQKKKSKKITNKGVPTEIYINSSDNENEEEEDEAEEEEEEGGADLILLDDDEVQHRDQTEEDASIASSTRSDRSTEKPKSFIRDRLSANSNVNVQSHEDEGSTSVCGKRKFDNISGKKRKKFSKNKRKKNKILQIENSTQSSEKKKKKIWQDASSPNSKQFKKLSKV